MAAQNSKNSKNTLQAIIHNFITSGSKEKLEPTTHFKLVFLNLTLSLALVVDGYIFVKQLLNGESSVSLLIIFQLAFFSTTLLIIRVVRNIKFISIFLLIVAMFSLLWNIPSGGIDKSGLFWLPVFPLVAVFLTGRIVGVTLTGIMIFLAWGLVYLGEMGLVRQSFTYIELSQSLVAFGAITVMVFIFESQRENYVESLNKKTIELEKYLLAVETAGDQIVISDPEGIVIYANPAAEKLTGYPLGEVIGKKAGALWGGYMAKVYYENLWRTIKSEKKVFIGRMKNKNKAGEFYYVDIKISPILDGKGEVKFFVSVERDASREFLIEKAKRQLDAFFDLSPELMLIAGADGYFKKINSSFSKILEFTEKELLETPFIKFIHPDDVKATQKEVAGLVKGEKTIHFTNRFKKKNGDYVWLQWDAIAEGSTIYASARDVSKEKEVDRMKTEFISLASHQLKTPATGVKAFLSMLLDGDAGELNSTQKDFVATAYNGNEQELKIVEDLLNVSRIEAGRLVLTKSKFDLSELVEDMVTQFSGAAAVKKQKIKFSKSQGVFNFDGDKNKLWMAIGNFIDNAMKYTPEKGTITVKIAEVSDHFEISVKDTGVGISQSDLGRLFQKFSRIDNPLSVKAGGSGLGLYLSQKIIELHQGEIKVNSEVGKGTEFVIQLPKGK